MRLQYVLEWTLGIRFNDCVDFWEAEATIKILLKQNPEYLRREKTFTDSVARLLDEVKADGYINQQLSTAVLAEAFMSFLRDAAFKELLDTSKCTLDELTTTLMWILTGGSYLCDMAGSPLHEKSVPLPE